MNKKTWEAVDGNPNNTGYRIFEGDQYIGFIGDSDQKTDAKANAQLIAAAPELLEALEAMVDMVRMDGFGSYQALDIADEAIKKARGEL